MQCLFAFRLAVLLSALTAFGQSISGRAQPVFEVLHSFGAANDGSLPISAPTVGYDGCVYGTTVYGGSNASPKGTVFKFNPTNQDYAVLRTFIYESYSDLMNPEGPVVQDVDGVIYGTTRSDAIYRLDSNGQNYSAVCGRYGAESGSVLIGQDRALYAARMYQSAAKPAAIIRVGRDGSDFSEIYTLPEGFDLFPSLVQDSVGVLYGVYTVTNFSGVFRIATNGTGFTSLWGSTAQITFAPLCLSRNGTLFGVSKSGGTNNTGRIFRLNRDGSGFQSIFDFGTDPRQGMNPNISLVEGPTGCLYGATGPLPASSVLFRINQDGTGYAPLVRMPICGLAVTSDDTVYGLSSGYGGYGNGMLFSLKLNPFWLENQSVWPDGSVQFTLRGLPDNQYDIQYSEDAIHWVVERTVTTTSPTLVINTAPRPFSSPRFYRAAWHL